MTSRNIWDCLDRLQSNDESNKSNEDRKTINLTGDTGLKCISEASNVIANLPKSNKDKLRDPPVLHLANVQKKLRMEQLDFKRKLHGLGKIDSKSSEFEKPLDLSNRSDESTSTVLFEHPLDLSLKKESDIVLSTRSSHNFSFYQQIDNCKKVSPVRPHISGKPVVTDSNGNLSMSKFSDDKTQTEVLLHNSVKLTTAAAVAELLPNLQWQKPGLCDSNVLCVNTLPVLSMGNIGLNQNLQSVGITSVMDSHNKKTISLTSPVVSSLYSTSNLSESVHLCQQKVVASSSSVLKEPALNVPNYKVQRKSKGIFKTSSPRSAESFPRSKTLPLAHVRPNRVLQMTPTTTDATDVMMCAPLPAIENAKDICHTSSFNTVSSFCSNGAVPVVNPIVQTQDYSGSPPYLSTLSPDNFPSSAVVNEQCMLSPKMPMLSPHASSSLSCITVAAKVQHLHPIYSFANSSINDTESSDKHSTHAANVLECIPLRTSDILHSKVLSLQSDPLADQSELVVSAKMNDDVIQTLNDIDQKHPFDADNSPLSLPLSSFSSFDLSNMQKKVDKTVRLNAFTINSEFGREIYNKSKLPFHASLAFNSNTFGNTRSLKNLIVSTKYYRVIAPKFGFAVVDDAELVDLKSLQNKLNCEMDGRSKNTKQKSSQSKLNHCEKDSGNKVVKVAKGSNIQSTVANQKCSRTVVEPKSTKKVKTPTRKLQSESKHFSLTSLSGISVNQNIYSESNIETSVQNYSKTKRKSNGFSERLSGVGSSTKVKPILDKVTNSGNLRKRKVLTGFLISTRAMSKIASKQSEDFDTKVPAVIRKAEVSKLNNADELIQKNDSEVVIVSSTKRKSFGKVAVKVEVSDELDTDIKNDINICETDSLKNRKSSTKAVLLPSKKIKFDEENKYSKIQNETCQVETDEVDKTSILSENVTSKSVLKKRRKKKRRKIVRKSKIIIKLTSIPKYKKSMLNESTLYAMKEDQKFNFLHEPDNTDNCKAVQPDHSVKSLEETMLVSFKSDGRQKSSNGSGKKSSKIFKKTKEMLRMEVAWRKKESRKFTTKHEKQKAFKNVKENKKNQSLLRELANSEGYVAERKQSQHSSDNLFVDSHLLSREERSLQMALMRMTKMELKEEWSKVKTKKTAKGPSKTTNSVLKNNERESTIKDDGEKPKVDLIKVENDLQKKKEKKERKLKSKCNLSSVVTIDVHSDVCREPVFVGEDYSCRKRKMMSSVKSVISCKKKKMKSKTEKEETAKCQWIKKYIKGFRKKSNRRFRFRWKSGVWKRKSYSKQQLTTSEKEKRKIEKDFQSLLVDVEKQSLSPFNTITSKLSPLSNAEHSIRIFLRDDDGNMTATSSSVVSLSRRIIPPEVKRMITLTSHATGETVLHRAARLGYNDIALWCCESRYVDVNVEDFAGYIPLHESCIRSHVTIAKYLIHYGADVNRAAARRDGVRPLHEAVDCDCLEMVRLLLSAGADINLTTYSGKTVEEFAHSKNMKQFLGDYRADLNGNTTIESEWSLSPCWNDSADVAMETGVDILADAPDDEPTDGFLVAFEFSDEPLLTTCVHSKAGDTTEITDDDNVIFFPSSSRDHRNNDVSFVSHSFIEYKKRFSHSQEISS